MNSRKIVFSQVMDLLPMNRFRSSVSMNNLSNANEVRDWRRLDHSLYTIPQVLSVSLGEKTPISQLLADRGRNDNDTQTCNQLSLFE
jgi:hypothetical protein